MFEQCKLRSRKKKSRNYSDKKSIKSTNLILSTSNVNNISKSKYTISPILSTTLNENNELSMIFKQSQFNIKVPKNTAVHFGNFYGLWDDAGKACYNNHKNSYLTNKETLIKKPHRLEFTRQMMHELERATDTKDYMRQVSVLLKKTVEPPDFRLNQLPSRNSIPDGSRSSSNYPLWYKEPYKISSVFSNPIAQLKHDRI